MSVRLVFVSRSLAVCGTAVHYGVHSENIKVCFAWISSNRAADSFRGHLALTFLAPESKEEISLNLWQISGLIFVEVTLITRPVSFFFFFHIGSKHREREREKSSDNCTDRFNVTHLSILESFFNMIHPETKHRIKKSFLKSCLYSQGISLLESQRQSNHRNKWW